MSEDFCFDSITKFRDHLTDELARDALFELPSPDSVQGITLGGTARDVRDALSHAVAVPLGIGAMSIAPESAIENLQLLASMDISLMKERGFSSLYCGLGLIAWADDAEHESRSAPLLLVPLRIHGLGTKELAVQQIGKPILNQPLLKRIGLLRSAFPIDPLGFQPKRSHKSVRGFSDRAVIGLFNWVGRALAENLDHCFNKSISRPPLVSMMLGPSTAALTSERSRHLEPKCHLPCDSDQFEAVRAIAEGKSLLVYGPPGTGKTQTITNVIAHLLEARKRILLLSDAVNALDPVLARLQSLVSAEILDLRAGRNSSFAVDHGTFEEIYNELARKPLSEQPELVVTTPGSHLMVVPPSWAFDMVICDEASRTRLAYALPALAVGRQVMIVGDHQQCGPPRTIKLTEQGTIADNGDISLLDAARSAKLPSIKLSRHYRSLHPSLINFSNERFYACSLKAVPSPYSRGPYGCVLRRIEGGMFSAGANSVEASELVRRVLHQIDQSDRPVGIVAMTHKQCALIAKMLKAEAPNYKDLVTVMHASNCQGVERDIMYVSLTYGSDRNGLQKQNFGILSDMDGDRVLNVCLTRARIRTEVFSSIQTTKLNPDARSAIGSVADFLVSHDEIDKIDVFLPTESDFSRWFGRSYFYSIKQFQNIIIFTQKRNENRKYAVQITGTQSILDDTSQRTQLENNGWNVIDIDRKIINNQEWYSDSRFSEMIDDLNFMKRSHT